MVERSPEHRPVEPEVNIGGDNAPSPSLREELLTMFPEHCRNGLGVLQRGRVCAYLSTYIDLCIVDANTDEARNNAIEAAETWEQLCPKGPRYPATGTLLKCGATADNFYPQPPERTAS